MRHTFYFGRLRPHHAYLFNRQDVCIVGFREALTTAAKKIWLLVERSIVGLRQKRRGRSEGVPPHVPMFLSEKWDF